MRRVQHKIYSVESEAKSVASTASLGCAMRVHVVRSGESWVAQLMTTQNDLSHEEGGSGAGSSGNEAVGRDHTSTAGATRGGSRGSRRASRSSRAATGSGGRGGAGSGRRRVVVVVVVAVRRAGRAGRARGAGARRRVKAVVGLALRDGHLGRVVWLSGGVVDDKGELSARGLVDSPRVATGGTGLLRELLQWGSAGVLALDDGEVNITLGASPGDGSRLCDAERRVVRESATFDTMHDRNILNRVSTNLALDELRRALDGGGLSRDGKGDKGGDGSESLHFWKK